MPMLPLDLDAIDVRHDAAVLVGRKLTDGGLLNVTDLDKLFACCSDVVDVMAYAAELEAKVKTIESKDSLLCNCSSFDSQPTNINTKAPMDHHCDCPAVLASAVMLGAFRLTAHAAQCTCSETETEARLRSNPQLVVEIEHAMKHPETLVRRRRPSRVGETTNGGS